MKIFFYKLPRDVRPLKDRVAFASPPSHSIETLEARRFLSLVPVQPASAIPFQQVTIDANPGTVPVVKVLADVLGRGKLDVVVGHENNLGGGGIFWYEQPASGNLNDPWIKHTIDANASTYEAAYPFDVNGDGAVDLVFSDHNQTVWYENPRGRGGDPRSAPWARHVIGNFNSHEIYLADLNGDGKPDIATNDAIYFQNSPDSWTTVAAPLFDHTVKGLALFDSGSGLGAVDLVVTGNSLDNITWYENPRDHGGNAMTDPWIPHIVGNAYVPTGDQINDPGLGVSFATIDVNGDGRMDIVSADGEAGPPLPAGGLMWWEAPADRRNGMWIPHTIDAGVQLVHNIRIADMNGDDHPDLVVFEQDQTAQQRLMVVYNEGGTGQNWLEQTLATTGGHNEWTGDVTGDGDQDILYSRHGFYTQRNPIELFVNGSAESGIVRATITSPPISQTIASGSPVTFQVSATGSGPLAYQWQQNGLDIPGATSSAYTIASARTPDNGTTFRCIVSNSAGFVYSPGALLTFSDIQPPPPLPPVDNSPPTATLTMPPPVHPATGLPLEFIVTFSDTTAVNASTLGNGNVIVTGPGGYSQTATLISTGLVDAASIAAIYSVPNPTIDGTYIVSTGANPVIDLAGNALVRGVIGGFEQSIPPIAVNGPDLTAALVGTQPTSVISGAKGTMRVRIRNDGNSVARGIVHVSVFTSTDGTPQTINTLITPTSGGSLKLNLKPRGSKIVNLAFLYPADLAAGNYRIGAWVDSANDLNEINASNKTVSGPLVTIAPPTVSFKASFPGKLPPIVTRGRVATFLMSVANLGNVRLTDKFDVRLSEASDPDLDGPTVPLGVVRKSLANVKPGKSTTFSVKLRIPASITPGQGFLVAVMSSTSNGAASSTVVNPTAIAFQ